MFSSSDNWTNAAVARAPLAAASRIRGPARSVRHVRGGERGADPEVKDRKVERGVAGETPSGFRTRRRNGLRQAVVSVENEWRPSAKTSLMSSRRLVEKQEISLGMDSSSKASLGRCYDWLAAGLPKTGSDILREHDQSGQLCASAVTSLTGS